MRNPRDKPRRDDEAEKSIVSEEESGGESSFLGKRQGTEEDEVLNILRLVHSLNRLFLIALFDVKTSQSMKLAERKIQISMD